MTRATHARLMGRAIAFATCTISMAFAPVAAAQEVPRCEGHNRRTARAAEREGVAMYRRAGAPDIEREASVRYFQLALDAFDRQCAAGNVAALERRVHPLIALGRNAEAAASLAAFLATQPRTRLDGEALARVEHAEALLRTAPAPTPPTVATPAVEPPPPVTDPTPVPGLLTTVPVTTIVEPPPDPPPPPPVDLRVAPLPPQPASLQPWPWVSTGVAGAFLLGGVGLALVREDRAIAYNNGMCNVTMTPACDATLAQIDTARGVMIGSFIIGGLAAVASAVLWGVEAHRRPAHR